MSSSILLTTPKHLITHTSFDPEEQPVIAIDALAALKRDTLQADFIRAAFKAKVSWQVEPIFKDSFVAEFEQSPQSVPSAVLIGLLQRPQGLAMLFTKRTMRLMAHAGQVCFPGGRIDDSDANAREAAVRETHEEVGIASEFIEAVGEHPIFLSSTHFAMRPVIGFIHEGYTIRPSAAEVEYVFEVPLSVLMNPQYFSLHRVRAKEGTGRFYFSVRWKQHFIWGATAVLVRNLYRFLAAAQKQLR